LLTHFVRAAGHRRLFPLSVHLSLIVRRTRPDALVRARIRSPGLDSPLSRREDVLIPGSFEYHRPASLSDAVALLGRLDSDARLIAGGHSLIPMMKLRLAMPTHLVDLAGVAELKGVRLDGGEVVIGAMTTQREIIASGVLAEHAPILRETAEVIADPQVRYVGTIGGNVANGDPGNDMPAVMMALGATYALRGPDGERRVPARDYYLGLYETAAKPGEVLTAVRIPKPPARHGWAYEKLKRKVGDYATAAAAVILTVSNGRIATCAIGLTNVAGTALLASDAATAVVGSALEKPALARASGAATAASSPAEDGRGSAEYRAKMAGVMTARALARAFTRATS
jgi:carbon-monoxide dehydrogenase medium subunit